MPMTALARRPARFAVRSAAATTLAFLAANGISSICTADPVAAPRPSDIAPDGDAKQAQDADAATPQTFFARHCLACHGPRNAEGELRVDRLAEDFEGPAAQKRWTVLLGRVQKGEMPPQGRPRPTKAEIDALAAWVGNGLRGAESKRRAVEGRVVLRRLNREEYNNTLRDLLGIRLDLREQLPADGSANGFDNAASALHTSSFLLERYLEAADAALNRAIVNLPQPPTIDKRLVLRDERHVQVTTEKVFRRTDDALVLFCSSAWQAVGINQFYPPDPGTYRFRISSSAVQSDGRPVTFRVVHSRSRLTGKEGLVGYFDARPGEPQVVEIVEHFEPRTTISILPYGLTSAQAVNKIGADAWEGPGVAIQYVEVTGPLHASWPPAGHRRIFGDLKQGPAPIYNQSKRVEVVSDRPREDAERILRTFARRAFRRAVSDDDVRPFVEVAQARLDGGASFEQAVRAALKGILVSPDFLFLREVPGQLDGFALANRLSYFLWSSMPDDELLDLAEQGRLAEPDVLRAQVERLLRDPKATAFTENFVGQWLGLREIDFTEPSHILYPEFDHLLKVSMIREVELYFDELLRQDLSVVRFVDSDFTMLNGRLAKHYGIAGPEGFEFRRTPVPPDSLRGGVLTMAGVLKVTANGTTTSPVVRGAWILDRILGSPPSPPPDDVPVLDPDIRGAVTIREQLAKHRTTERCAACHVHIDPPGFALESFDCIGGRRDRYRVTGAGESVVVDGRRMAYHIGKPVDPADVLPDGRRFAHVGELKQHLAEDPDRLARALAGRLLAYATGAAPAESDRPAVEAVVASVRDRKYGLRSLVHAVVQSELFRTK